MANRYALRMDLPQSWAIIDVFTGQPVVVRRRAMVGMSPRYADAMVDQMSGTSSAGRRRSVNPDPVPTACVVSAEVFRRQHIHALARAVIGL